MQKETKVLFLWIEIVTLLLYFVGGCSEEIAKKYTGKNILIGALIGGFIPIVLFALGTVFKKESSTNETLGTERMEDKKAKEALSKAINAETSGRWDEAISLYIAIMAHYQGTQTAKDAATSLKSLKKRINNKEKENLRMDESKKEVDNNTPNANNKSVTQTEGLPWGIIAYAAAGVFLYMHKNELTQKGGFLYIIGAIFIAVFTANLLTRK